jgi:lipopolysaccharide export system ATP-binding protein
MISDNQVCLDVVGLEKSYGGRKVVNGLSFHVNQGEVVGLLGPNGAGKTTAFYMTMGLIAQDKGRVTFNGEDVSHLPIHKRALKGMGYLAQEPSIFRTLSVEDNILCILESLNLPKAEEKKRLDELLLELHLAPLRKKMAASLSGGERRRLEITRALVTNPTFLLLDEPFANIDPISIQEVKDLIKILARKKISILITDHNAREIFSIVDRSYLVFEGRNIKSGRVDELIHDDEVKRTYLGEHFKM